MGPKRKAGARHDSGFVQRGTSHKSHEVSADPSLTLAIGACGETAPPAAQPAARPTAADAKEFLKRYDQENRAIYEETSAAQWVQANFITDDTQLLSAKASESGRFLKGHYLSNFDR